jgi:hypothetical protein
MTSVEMVTSGDDRDIISHMRFFYILLKDTPPLQGEYEDMRGRGEVGAPPLPLGP